MTSPPSPSPASSGLPAGRGVRLRLRTPPSDPLLEVRGAAGRWSRVSLEAAPDDPEGSLQAAFEPPGERWQFRLRSAGDPRGAAQGPFDVVGPAELWLQRGELFYHAPAARVSASRVERIDEVDGRLGPRTLYVYLPRGYDDHPQRRYPVIWMHDGQNCFEAFVEDSYAGSWKADLAADRLIAGGRMRESIVVGVANGGPRRLAEYLPPYASLTRVPGPQGKRPARAETIRGGADRTAEAYTRDLAPFVDARYRTLRGRDATATCGSSMGGLFSLYLAWEHPEFARHHAALSPSVWATCLPDGRLELVERLRSGPRRDLRLWLDSGTGRTGVPGRDDDNRFVTEAARDALLEVGYRYGPDFHYLLAEGAAHSEAAWAARLPAVLAFLMPPGPAPLPVPAVQPPARRSRPEPETGPDVRSEER